MSDRRKHMLVRVRDYMRDREDRRHERRSRRTDPIPALLDQVQLYVSELEHVFEGIESHPAVLRSMREESMLALGEIAAEGQRTGRESLFLYEHDARRYVDVLEAYMAGEVTSCRASVEYYRISYESRRKALSVSDG